MPASLSSKNISLSALVGNDVFVPVDPSSYDLLETTILTSSASSVSFTGLGSYTDYKHLQIRLTARGDDSVSAQTGLVTFNSDTGSNYSSHNLFGDGSTVDSFAITSDTSFGFGVIPYASATANSFGASVIDILDFADTSKNTTVRALYGDESGSGQIGLRSGLYINTGAITSFELSASSSASRNFVSGSRFSLYGIKAA